MKNTSIGWISLVLLLVLVAGCGSGSGNLAEGLTPNPSAILSHTPANGQTDVSSNAVVTVVFDRAMNGSTVVFTLVKKGLLVDDPVPSTVSTTDNVTFTLKPDSLPLQTITSYTASVAKGAKDPAGNTLPEAVSWTFTTELPPAVKGTVPKENAPAVPVNTAVSVTFTRAMSADTVSVVVVNTNTGTPVPVGNRSFTSDNTVLTVVPQSNLTAGNVFSVKVFGTSKDMHGNPMGTDKIWSFTTESPPIVTANSPPKDATGVFTDNQITVTFNRTIRSLSAEVKLGSNPLPFNWPPNGDNTVWTFIPPGGKLEADGSYSVRIITATDVRGTTMQEEYTWRFETEKAPTVTSANPPLDGSGIVPYPIDSAFNVTVNFSKAMDPATLDNAIHLTRSGGTDVPGTVSVTSPTRATFTPKDPPLAPDTTYNVEVTQAAKDSRGNPLRAQTVWAFGTASPPPLPVPAPLKVVSAYPDNNAERVSIRTPIVVNFDASANPFTVTAASFRLRNVTDSVDVPGLFSKFDKAVIFYPYPNHLNPDRKEYRLTIDNSVKSSLGGALDNGYSSGFTTDVSDVLWSSGDAGGFHAAIVLDNGSLYAWGKNSDGQIGDNTLVNRNTPVRIATDNNGNLLPLIANVSLGKYHTLALDTGGGVWAWGNNTYGQLGDNTLTTRLAPVEVVFDPPLAVPIIALTAGEFHSLALDRDGNVHAWGNNTSGQLGDGTAGNNRLLPVEIFFPAIVKSISAGSRHSVALDTAGNIWAWGNNDYGQFGNGTTLGRLSPFQVTSLSYPSPVCIPGSGTTGPVNFTNVSAGDFHTLFLGDMAAGCSTNKGLLFSAGRNNVGQLGTGSPVGSTVMVEILRNVVAISAGGDSSFVSQSSGTAYAWGRNDSGQLGDGTTTNRFSPTPVKDLTGAEEMSGVSSVSFGNSFTVWLRTGGRVFSGGANDFGQLGNGVDAPNAALPVPVFGF